MIHNTNDVKQRVESEYQREEQTVDTSDEAGMMSVAFCAVATGSSEAAFSFF
jgi:hypothetical protein